MKNKFFLVCIALSFMCLSAHADNVVVNIYNNSNGYSGFGGHSYSNKGYGLNTNGYYIISKTGTRYSASPSKHKRQRHTTISDSGVSRSKLKREAHSYYDM